MSDNDNNPDTGKPKVPAPDAHGQAALLLVESLIHGLVERSVINLDDALDIVDTADSVQIDIAEVADGAAAPMWRSHQLLTAIAESMKPGDGNTSL